jgi:serine/threonine protein kinase
MTTVRPEDADPGLIGAVIGSYQITAELSHGGMGAVYRARHMLIGKEAAVKLLRPELTANQELVERFFNEAKAASQIRHPGIVEVFDFGHYEDGRAFIIMEFLEGEPLGKRIADRGRLTEIEAATIARGIASALNAAHAKGIIHRDLKPDNVFLVPDPDLPGGERAKVLDFGIAKLADNTDPDVHHTQTGALMGTPLYMAPEQARAAGETDGRADLYSLGCMLYEMLTGAPPFVAIGAGEIIAMQLFTPPESPSTKLAELSPEMERIVMRLLEKNPDDRFQRANDVSEALVAITGRLSSRLSAPIAAAQQHAGFSGAMAAARMTPLPKLDASKIGIPLLPPDALGGPPEMAQKKSAMPIIAGVITVLLAGAGAAFVFTRGGGGGVGDATTASGSGSELANPAGSASGSNAAKPDPSPKLATQPADTKATAAETKPTTSSDGKHLEPAHDAKVEATRPRHGGGEHAEHVEHVTGAPVKQGAVMRPDLGGPGPSMTPGTDPVHPNGATTTTGAPIETGLGPDKAAAKPTDAPAPPASPTPTPAPAPKADPPKADPAPAPSSKPADPPPAKDS